MRWRLKLCALALSLPLCATYGCAQQQARDAYIGADRARELALAAVGLHAPEAEFSSVELAAYEGTDCYRLVFTAGGQTHTLAVDAVTGQVLAQGATDGAAPQESLVTDADTFS